MRQKRPLPKVLTDAESENLRRACTNTRDRAAVALMLDLGLRVSECAGVRLSDINWTERILLVHGKGGREDELPIPGHVREALEQALRERPAEATHEFLLWSLTDPSRPVTRYGLWKMVVRLGRRSGLGRQLYPHLLRHSLGSRLYRQHGDMGIVQKVLRHVRLSTTAIYVHLTTEQQRQRIEALDPRSWLARWWSRMAPPGVPGTVRSKAKPLALGDTVGRVAVMGELRTNFRRRISTVLVAPHGSGRRHLLAMVTGKNVYRLERLAPPKACMVELCTLLVADGHLPAQPKGNSMKPSLRAIMDVGKSGEFTLVVASLDELVGDVVRNLRQIAETWLVFAAIEPQEKAAAERVFFGRARFIDVVPLSKTETHELARRAMGKHGVTVPDEAAYLAQVWANSQGNPGAILSMVEDTAKTGRRVLEHPAGPQVLSATPILTAIWTIVIFLRYGASAVSEPQWKIWATIVLVGLLPFFVLDKILIARSRRKR